MHEPRLKEAAAALDDARSLIVDVVDDRPEDATPRDLNNLDAARQFINAAIPYIQSADSDEAS